MRGVIGAARPMRCCANCTIVSEPSIARATEEDVRYFALRRYADELSRRLYLQLSERAFSGAWVARDEATPIAIGFADDLDDERFVSELYVEPSFRGTGIGRRLWERCIGDDERPCSTLLGASDTPSLAFVTARALALATPVVRIAGAIAREDELARMAASDERFEVDTIDPLRHRFALDALDRDVRGSSRADDHRQWAASATGATFFLRGECVGYAYVWPDGRVGPIASSSHAYLRAIVAFAMAALTRTYRASWCTLLVPGS